MQKNEERKQKRKRVVACLLARAHNEEIALYGVHEQCRQDEARLAQLVRAWV